MFERFSKKARYVLLFARHEVEELGDYSMQSYHLLLGLVREGKYIIREFLPEYNSQNLLEMFRKKIQEKIGIKQPTHLAHVPVSPEIQGILRHSLAAARVLSQRRVEPVHLLLAVLWEERSVAATILNEVGLNSEEIHSKLEVSTHISEMKLNLQLVCKKLGISFGVLPEAAEAAERLSLLPTEEDIKFLDSLKLRS